MNKCLLLDSYFQEWQSDTGFCTDGKSHYKSRGPLRWLPSCCHFLPLFPWLKRPCALFHCRLLSNGQGQTDRHIFHFSPELAKLSQIPFRGFFKVLLLTALIFIRRLFSRVKRYFPSWRTFPVDDYSCSVYHVQKWNGKRMMNRQKEVKLFACPPWIFIYLLLVAGLGIRYLVKKLFQLKSDASDKQHRDDPVQQSIEAPPQWQGNRRQERDPSSYSFVPLSPGKIFTG